MTSPRVQLLINNVRGEQILNLGYLGKGKDGSWLHQQIEAQNARAMVVAADHNQQLMQHYSQTHQVAADGFELPFRKGTFDAVVIGEFLEHFYHIQPCLKEISRVLSRGGKLYITTPNAVSLLRLLQNWFLVSSSTWISYQNARDRLGDADHKVIWEPLSLVSILHQVKLETIHMSTHCLGWSSIPFLAETSIPFWPFSRGGYYLCLIAQKI